MNGSFTLGVYRRLDNRFEGLSDDSPRALELHNRRKAALQEAFGPDSGVRVADWGDTNDSSPHEYVELVLGAAATVTFQTVIVPGAKWLGQQLAEKAVETGVAEFVKKIFAFLSDPQKKKQLLNYDIRCPDGTRISVDPPDRYATIHITFKNGELRSIEYLKDVDQGSR